MAQTTHDVTVGDNFFSPANLEIEVGDTVRWTNAAGGNFHDVTEQGGAWASQTASSFVYERTFNTPEEVDYFCSVHPATMRGSITVTESSGGQGIDLAVNSVDADAGPFEPGDVVPVQVQVENYGDTGSAAYTVRYYASTDGEITEGDVELGSDNRPALAAGATDDFAGGPVLPESLPDGSYTIGVVIEVDDIDNANNSGFDATAIQVMAPPAITVVFNETFNDSWRDPVKKGNQAFFIIIYPSSGFIWLAWFTYDTELSDGDDDTNIGYPGAVWFTALGTFDGDEALLDLNVAENGLFVSSVQADESTIGSITIKAISCDELEITYEIFGTGLMGTIIVSRVLNDGVAACEASQP
jgi:hypothetical protein